MGADELSLLGGSSPQSAPGAVSCAHGVPPVPPLVPAAGAAAPASSVSAAGCNAPALAVGQTLPLGHLTVGDAIREAACVSLLEAETNPNPSGNPLRGIVAHKGVSLSLFISTYSDILALSLFGPLFIRISLYTSSFEQYMKFSLFM